MTDKIIRGDSLRVLETMDTASFDALITDPPYASGGRTRGEKNLSPSKKYQNSSTIKRYPGGDFANDNLDQRSWTKWCVEWLQESRRIVKPGGYALVFVDWRQLPALTDAFQMAGWTWRGLIAWDKTESSRAPHKGYFRHQAEYIVWGSNGALRAATHDGPYPGVLRQRVNASEKLHVTGKPLAVMRELVRCVPPGGSVLDPFCGSGMTIRAALEQGRDGLGIELSDECYQVALNNLNSVSPES